MEENKKCFYCDYEIEGRSYVINFDKDNKEHSAHLCDVCYPEWLEGLKE
jgi:hypothetical protein